MKLKFFLLLSLIIAISCDKSDEAILQDHILHTDVQPDSLVSVIDSLKYDGLLPGESCISHVYSSTENYYDLDLNRDGIQDYRISHHYGKTYNETWSPHNPCDSVFGFEIRIESLNGRNTIVTDTSRYIWYPTYAALEMDTAGVINSEEPSATTAYLFFKMPYIVRFIPNPADMMVGLILSEDNSINYGWLSLTARSLGFTVKEYAVNLTPGKEIIAGLKANSN